MSDHDQADISYLSNRKAQSDMDWYRQLQQQYGQSAKPQAEQGQPQDQNAGPEQNKEAGNEPASGQFSYNPAQEKQIEGPAGGGLQKPLVDPIDLATFGVSAFGKSLADTAIQKGVSVLSREAIGPAMNEAAKTAAMFGMMGAGQEAAGPAAEALKAKGPAGEVAGGALEQAAGILPAVAMGAAGEAVPGETAAASTEMGEEGGSSTPPGGIPPQPSPGTHNIQQMNEAARGNPMSQEEIAGLTLRGPSFGDHTVLENPVSAEDMLRLHHTASNQVQNFLDLAERLKSDPYVDMEKGQAQLDEMFKSLAGDDGSIAKWRAGLHQMGLGLRALGQPASESSPMLKDVYEAIKESNGDLDNTIKALGSLKTEAQRKELLDQAAAGGLQTLGTAISHYYTESKLSFNTVVKKLSSDALMLAFSVPERAIAEAGGYGRAAVGANPAVAPGETASMIRGAIDGFKDAVHLGYKAFQTDTPTFEGSIGFGEARQPAVSSAGTRFEDTWIGRGIDWMGQALHLPGRMILGVDQWAKSMNFTMQARALSYREAMNEALASGKEGEDFSRAFEKAYNAKLGKMPSSIMQQASEYANTQTFGAPMDSGGLVGNFLQAAQKAQQTTLGRFIAPFFPTPVNLTRTAMEYGGPLGLLSKAMRDRMMAGGADGDLAMARMGLSSLMTWAVADHVMKGNITGKGPEQPDIRKLWLEQGNQSYSIRVGDHEIGNLPEPFSTAMGLIADTIEVASRAEQQDGTSLGAAGLTVMSRMIEHQSFLQNIVSLVHILDAGNHGQGVGGDIKKLAASVLPSNVVDIAHSTDPIMRQQQGIVDAIKARTPGLSKTLPPDRDLFGNPYLMPLGSDDAGGIISMFKTTKVQDDPVVKELVRLEPNVTKLNQSYGGSMPKLLQPPGAKVGVPLTPEQLDHQAQLRGTFRDPDTGQNLKEALQSVINDKDYKEATDIDKKKVLEETIAGYSHAAEAQTYADYPDLQAKYANVLNQRANASMGSASRLGAP